MKRVIKTIMILMLLVMGERVKACEKNFEEFKEIGIAHSYVVGEYVFNLDYGYSPSLEDFAVAARTIPEGEEEYIYEFTIDGNLYEATELFSQKTSYDKEEFPYLDLTYHYRAHIRGAKESDYDIFTCPSKYIKVEYTGLITDGDGEYKTSATRYISVQSKEEIASSKYCITTGESCTPNKEVEVSGNPGVMEIEYPTHESGQRICVEVKDVLGGSTQTKCDTVLVKVDREPASIKATDKYSTTIQGEPHEIDELFEITYGVSGGKAYYYYYDTEGKNILTNLAELPEGDIRVEVMVRSGNGLVSKLSRTIKVKKHVVTYDYQTNGGTSASEESLKVSYQGRANLKVSATKAGYEFVGWNTEKDAKTAIEKLEVNEDITLYAIYKKELTSNYEIYTLGSIPAVSEYDESKCTIYNKETSCEVEVPAISARIGYEVLGWTNKAGSTTPTIVDETKITITKDETYYSVTRNKMAITGNFHIYRDNKVIEEVNKCYAYNGATSCNVEVPDNYSEYRGLRAVGFTKTPTTPTKETNFTQTKGEDYYLYYEDEFKIDYISGNNLTKETDKAHVYYVVGQDEVAKDVEEKTLRESAAIAGFNRIGWREDTESTEGTSSIGETIKVENDTTYYGVYEKNVSLKYEGDTETTNIPEGDTQKSYYNSGSQEQSEVVFIVDEANEIKKKNYLFATWTKEEDKVAAGSQLVTKDDVTLAAEWVENGHKVTYNYSMNGGVRADKSSEVFLNDEEEAIDLTEIKAYKTGWKFIGWHTNPDAISAPMGSIKPKQDTTLYAMFEKDVEVKYQVQDDVALTLKQDNYQTCKMYNRDTTCKIRLPEVVVIDEEYEFIGWNRDKESITSEYEALEELNVDSNETYYTISKNREALEARYHYYEGDTKKTEIVECIRYNKGTTCKAEPTITGKVYNKGTLNGWSTNKDIINYTTNYTIGTNTDYYGVYDRILSVTYQSGDESGSVLTKTAKMNYITSDTGVEAIGTEITLENPDGIIGYTTVGWREDTVSADATDRSGSKKTIVDDKVYNGVYKKEVELSYNANGGITTPATQKKTMYYNSASGKSCKEITTNFTLAGAIEKVGHKFNGWLKGGDDGASYPALGTIAIGENTKMYANWGLERFTVTYDYQTNGGTSVTSATKGVSFQEPIDLTVDAYKEGYEFVGWNEDANAKVGIESMEMPAEDVKLYAIYKKELTAKWLVTDVKSGIVERGTTSCNIYNKETECMVETGNMIMNTGYSVLGWTEEQGKTEVTVGANSYTYINKNMTYYSVTSRTKPVVGTFYYYDQAIKSIENQCLLYNGATTCTVVAPVSPLEYNGAAFINWSSSENSYVASSMTIGTDTNYYSYYEKILELIYHEGLNDKAGKTISTAIKKHVIGKTSVATINPKVILKTEEAIANYTNVGWRKDTSPADKHHANGEEITLEDSMDIYAVYTRVLTLSYNGNNGSTPSKQTTTQHYNSYGNYTSHTFTLAPAATRTGYTFQKWMLNKIGGTEYNAGASISILEDTLMYAKWKANTYTIKYAGGGATGGSTVDSIHTYDVAKALTANGFTRAYTVTYNHNYSGSTNTSKTATYTFKNWLHPNGSTTYTDKQSVLNLSPTQGAVLTMTAEWNSASVSYTPTRTGYIFNGWDTTSACSSASKINGNYTPTKNITLYACWTPITYTVKYAGGGATGGSTANSIHTYDVAKALTANGFTRAYTVTYNHNYSGSTNTSKTATYTFKNWKNGSTTYTDKQSVVNLSATNGGTVTLTAQWNSASVSYSPTRTGYTFKGWDTTSACSTATKITGNYTPTKNITLYACWQANDYTLTLNANGGTVTPTTMTVRYNQQYNYNRSLPTPTRTGYTFKGWYTATSGGTNITNTTKMTTASNHTLYARWTIKSYTVTMSVTGGSANPTSLSINYGSSKTTTITPNSGYYLESVSCTNGYTTNATTGTSATSAQTITVYNNSKDNNSTCTVTFKPACPYKVGDYWEFNYTGGVQSFTAECAGSYKLEVYGAQGGNDIAAGGYGGYATGNIYLTKNNSLYVVVGEQGTSHISGAEYGVVAEGGYNGGGDGYMGEWSGDWRTTGGGGGGATHIATTNRGVLANYSSYRSEVLIVAGGGGGGSGAGNSSGCNSYKQENSQRLQGGSGGGITSGPITYNTYHYCKGDLVTSTTLNCTTYTTFGKGMDYNAENYGYTHCGDTSHYRYWNVGGGGGWFGGRVGAGGSGYIGNVTGGSMKNGSRAGNGYAKISVISLG